MASLDYYSVLGLPQDVSEDEIKRSYRKLAIKYHPERNISGEAAESFQKVSEAFDVLSDARKRAIYDQFGVDGLKKGVPSKDGFEGYSGGYSFNGRPEEVFKKFFGSSSAYQDLFNFDTNYRLFGSKFGGLNGMSKPESMQAPVQSAPIHHKLPLTLEELYLGTVKKIKIRKLILSNDGATTEPKDKILAIQVRRGWRKGTKITFPKEGDQGPNVIPADLVFTVEEISHPSFKRQDNDLHYTARIGLAEALTGTILNIKTLDDRVLNLTYSDVISPLVTKIVPNEGMPIAKDPKQRGSLIIHFDISFPKYLTETQKKNVRSALSHT